MGKFDERKKLFLKLKLLVELRGKSAACQNLIRQFLISILH